MTQLVPALARADAAGFNVFDVMRHGTHEKQLSNVFAWLLDAKGSHDLGDRFLRIFIDAVNEAHIDRAIPHGKYVVTQEVNTSAPGDDWDIADIVLESQAAGVVIENYYTSSGHGHGYERYLELAGRGGRSGTVVLLCRDQDSSLQVDGWHDAAVVTYATLTEKLQADVRADRQYEAAHPDVAMFISHMHRKFVKGRGPMQDQEVLDFLAAMCATGEARRYQERPQAAAAERFGADVAEQAAARFEDGREVLQRAKNLLRNHCAAAVVPQLNEALPGLGVKGVSARYQGIYEWTINFEMNVELEDLPEGRIQLKFGPSAWYAVNDDPFWTSTVDATVADYSRLFVTHAPKKLIQQSSVTLREVIDGLSPDDVRLRDEILQLIEID